MTRKIKHTELGVEIQCSRCKDFYPADREFFYTDPRRKHGCHSWCKGCYDANRRERRAKQKQAVGCAPRTVRAH